MKYVPRYENIFMYSSDQFSGHVEEYFSAHTKKLVVFVVMPRVKNKRNFLRVYVQGKRTEEKSLWSSENIFLYYISWYIQYLYFIFFYFSRGEPFFVLSFHPISFVGMSIQRLFRKITYIYWVGDYFPPTNKYLDWFEKLKKFYHDRVSYRYYLSDGIHRKINGKIIRDKTHKTVMWGVRSASGKKKYSRAKMSLLFVGLIKRGQGLEKLFSFLKANRSYTLKIIGVCDSILYSEYQNLIVELGIGKQVFFPNKFFSDQQLVKIAQACHIGLALYDVSPLSSAYYTDPGKVKSYTEMHLPVIMSNISSIAPYIKRYHAGEVIDGNPISLLTAIKTVSSKYQIYLNGVKAFNTFFSYESYYAKSFQAIERYE